MLEVTSPGTGSHVGIENRVLFNNGTTVENYGIHNIVDDNSTASGIGYGIKSVIGNALSTGTRYGIHSIAINDGTNPSYSGWFQGDRFAIRNEDASTGYDLTVATGTTGQVLTSNGSGQANWVNPPAAVDASVTNEGALTVTAGTNAANIVSNTAGSTAVTVAGGNNTNVSSTGSTITVTNRTPVQYSLWQGGDYNMNNITSYSDLGGIQTIFDPMQVDPTGNVELKLVIWVTDYASQTDFELQAYDVNGTGSIPILQTSLSYENNGGGGFITSGWIDYTAGTGSGNIAQLILRGLITGGDPNAQIRSVYVLIRPNQ